MPKRKPKVSVILSVHNRHEFLRPAIESILSQTFQDLELIIVDDGSDNPEPLHIADSYQHQDDRVCIVRHAKNIGLAAACNSGIQRASGEYIARMDDDDISLPHRIATQYRFLQDHPDYAAISCVIDSIDYHGKKKHSRIPQTPLLTSSEAALENMHLSQTYLLNPTAMFRRRAAIDIGGYRPYFRHAEDLDFTLRMEEVQQVGRINSEALYHYRSHTMARLSTHPACWYYIIAAYVSARERRLKHKDPIDDNPPIENMLAFFKQQQLPENIRLQILRHAFGYCRRVMATRDYHHLWEILNLCRYCVKDADSITKPLLAKLHRRIFKRALLYGRFGWVKHHFSACQTKPLTF